MIAPPASPHTLAMAYLALPCPSPSARLERRSEGTLTPDRVRRLPGHGAQERDTDDHDTSADGIPLTLAQRE